MSVVVAVSVTTTPGFKPVTEIGSTLSASESGCATRIRTTGGWLACDLEPPLQAAATTANAAAATTSKRRIPVTVAGPPGLPSHGLRASAVHGAHACGVGPPCSCPARRCRDGCRLARRLGAGRHRRGRSTGSEAAVTRQLLPLHRQDRVEEDQARHGTEEAAGDHPPQRRRDAV